MLKLVYCYCAQHFVNHLLMKVDNNLQSRFNSRLFDTDPLKLMMYLPFPIEVFQAFCHTNK